MEKKTKWIFHFCKVNETLFKLFEEMKIHLSVNWSESELSTNDVIAELFDNLHTNICENS